MKIRVTYRAKGYSRYGALLFCCMYGFLNAGHVLAQPSLTDIFQTSLTCALVDPLLADMPVDPVYAQDGSVCSSVVPDSAGTQYFSDASCQTPLDFEATTLASHCELLLDPGQLGEGAGVTTPVWTLSPGTRLDVGARSLDGVSQPYLQRLVYRNIETPRGTCSLEMRVYAKSPMKDDGQTRPSLLALHGGSWSARGFGFFGLELTIPHYVEQGFVVYAPFYRLLGDSEGSAACNQASIGEIAEDASAALAWLGEKAADYGSDSKPVVFGQSAGAHLATSLLVNEPDKVAGAVLFYPPTDFTDFALRAQLGLYNDEQGLDILERVLGVGTNAADINASPIPENSFPIRIVEQGIDVPPVMMVHGMRDTLVEARQSVRLCDALSGRMLQTVDSEVTPPTSLRQIIACGTDSQLQLIKEGQHALDVCFVDATFAFELCPAGSEASREEVAKAIDEAVDFAINLAGITLTDDTNDSIGGADSADVIDEAQSGKSGGAVTFWLLLVMIMQLTKNSWTCTKRRIQV